jgi:beta-galactosidase
MRRHFDRVAVPLIELLLMNTTLPADSPPVQARHTFEIGANDFLLDGKPFVIRCGEIHFPRVPCEYWRHRLQMCSALGLNTVCVYLFWNFHEWEEGKFDWSGQADAAEFCRLAQEEGLWVLLRPGPYSCAEWEMGGLPWWLVKHDKIGLRSKDPKFLEPAVRFMKEVGRVLSPLQITRGGPLLMVQVENEYGSFGKDADYMGALRKALLDGGFDVPLFACNPPGVIADGYREDLFQVVNFGAGGGKAAFETLHKFQKTGPLMNGEYYPAWFDMWGRKHRTGPAEPIIADLDYMLEHRHSFSIYMAHGGTSFGLWAGADRPFSPDTSSYDYDAPISEAGGRTPKFDTIRNLFAKHLQPGETLPAPPPANPVIAIPPFDLKEAAPIFANLPAAIKDEEPRTMEFYGQSRGCTLYRTTLPAGPRGTLTANGVHDFAWVFLDGKALGVMDRRSKRFQVELPARAQAARLDVLVEAMGRVNFGTEVYDRKGLFAPVKLAGSEMRNWEIFPLPFDDAQLSGLRYKAISGVNAPAFWRGSFEIATPSDTFLDVRQWQKGVAWINGHCLGRFWTIGPTQTMYVPGPWLKAGRNEVVMLDLTGPHEPRLSGLAQPILDELHPERDFSHKERATGTFDATALAPAAEGTFTPAIRWQDALFAAPVKGRYLCLEALSSLDGQPFAAVAEIDAIGEKGESLSKSEWKIFWVSSEETNYVPGDAENVLDGQPATYWQTDSAGATPPGYPHRLVIDLGEPRTLSGIRYLPRAGSAGEGGRIKAYQVYLSEKPFGLVGPR